MNNQAYLFIMFIINGILIGVLFDIFRILRKAFKTSDFITYVEDIVFWILTGILTLYFIFVYNSGEIRLYVFLGIAIGVLLYILTVSSYIIKFSVKTITYIKTIISKIINIILYPFKLTLNVLRKMLFRPISFIFINIRKVFRKNVLNMTNSIKKLNKIPKKSHN